MTTSIPPVIRAAFVARTPADSFAIFTDEIGAWWPLPTHGMFGAESGGLVFRDGALVEVATDGRETIWGEVIEWNPPQQLAFTWHPGREAGDSSQVEVTFEADGSGTRVVLAHRGWEVFGEEAMARRQSYVGPNAWGGVLDHFADVAEPRPDAADLTALHDGYKTFFALAERGGFGSAPEGEWDASQVVAHMALNDLAIVATCQQLVHGQTPSFANQICQSRDVLSNWIESSPEMAGLIARARGTSLQVLAAITRLSPEQLATEVPCYLTHDGEVSLDRSVPWSGVAIDAQGGVHIPAHIEQLQKLRD